MGTVAIGIICKTPAPGRSKTRLSPPLRPEECASISACFIRDLSRTIGALVLGGDVTGYAVYTPIGSEGALRSLLPTDFRLVPQVDGDFGARLFNGAADLLQAGHDGVLLVNSDSPTLPASTLRAAADAVRSADNVVLSPALDGGYTLIGLSKPHRRLFEDIVWSTSTVFQRTCERAAEIGLPVFEVPPWYDVDDAASLRILEAELSGAAPASLFTKGAEAPATRQFLRERQMSLSDRVAR
ncbi:TIGR04282 family arsenosugar biosynthesis glycosyltransferase [Reyranella sp.]|uniref:TIGR04282 family arsenosugar biosynthesis glycosyltransferase n=1 Tax=Reyranella sp. TaxID=1929291 RepID=UPI003D110E97